MEGLERAQAVPYHLPNGTKGVVMADPAALDHREGFFRKYGLPLIGIASSSAIRQVFGRGEMRGLALAGVSEDLGLQALPELQGAEHLSLPESVEDRPMIVLVHTLLAEAIRQRASDLHVEAAESACLVKFRVDGVLRQAMEPLATAFHPALVSRIKVMAELNVAEHRVPQDGRMKWRFQGRPIDFRVSILPTLYGEAVVIRVLDRQAQALTLSDLGFEPALLKHFDPLMRAPHGMLLVTGPTGSGKTTTLYAALRTLANGTEKIVTIEDPIEYLLPGVVQVPVNEKKGVTFASGLRSILRHDPDTIMVGEIRDPDTAQIAVQAALTGHRVYSTIHATSVVDVFGRLLHMGVRPHEFVSSFNAVLAQRLVRKLCSACKRKIATGYDAKGCAACQHSGYQGRTAVYELMVLTEPVKRLIAQEASFLDIRAAAKKDGMITLREACEVKVKRGETSEAELQRVMGVKEP